MFPNLNAEQRRRNWTDEHVASKLNITRGTYNYRKNRGTFKFNDIILLCELFDSDFEYLFHIQPNGKDTA